jgi:hypothetical protein
MTIELIWKDAAGGLQRMADSPQARRIAPKSAGRVDPATLPDRAFWPAWNFDSGAVTVDLEAARKIREAAIRARRDELWPAADAAVNAAQDDGDADAEAQARARRRALRAVPADPALAIAMSADELLAVWPACLGAKPDGD